MEPRRRLDVILREDLTQVLDGLLARSVVEEGGRQAIVARAAGTADAVDVIVNLVREVIVDDVDDIGDV